MNPFSVLYGHGGLTIGDGVRTPALEASLAGARCVLIDTMGMPDHRFFQWGRDTVAFRNWDELFATLARYRRDPASVPGLGDWSPVIAQFDPFRDGQAGRRMGEYLCWLLGRAASRLPLGGGTANRGR